MKTANAILAGIIGCEQGSLFDGDVLEYEGYRYLIGTEHKPMNVDWITDLDYSMLTPMVITKELNITGMTSGDVHLASGLPLTWVVRQKADNRGNCCKSPCGFPFQ